MAEDATLEPLVRAIDGLYAAFGGYAIRNPEPCPGCYPPEEVKRIGHHIRTQPLRSLTLDDVGHFYTDGLLTWGEVDDFRYLLPRLMELFAAWHVGVPHLRESESARGGGLVDAATSMDRWSDLYPEVAFRRFTDASWTEWPDSEQSAIRRYLWELWSTYLGPKTERPLPDAEWLETDLPAAILQLVPAPRRYLDHWLVAGSSAMRRLGWFITNDEVNDGFWESIYDGDPDRRANQLAVALWLGEVDTCSALEQAARDPSNAAIAWEIVLGLEVLKRGRDAIQFRAGQWVPDETSEVRARALGVQLRSRGNAAST